ncbi:MAG: peptidylprolyl isomerase [Chthoniobacterales bacterium]
MRRRLLFFIVACIGGAIAGEAVYRSAACRGGIARLTARLQGATGEAFLISGRLANLSRDEPIVPEELERELASLRNQFGNEEQFQKVLLSSGLKEKLLREELSQHLRDRGWIEKQIAPQLAVTEEECREFYEANRAKFAQPPRYRASHIFLAAPDGTAPEVIAAKQSAIQGLSVRILAGETLPALAAEASEDEATKFNGGDLGIFAAVRMAPEFVAEVEKLGLGTISPPIRSHLGFHIVELTGATPAHEMTFEETRPEIAVHLANKKRETAVETLLRRLKSTREAALD